MKTYWVDLNKNLNGLSVRVGEEIKRRETSLFCIKMESFHGKLSGILLILFTFLASTHVDGANKEIDRLSKTTFRYYLNEYAYQKSKSRFTVLNYDILPQSSASICTYCKYGASAFIQLRRIGVRRSVFARVAKFVCRVAGVDQEVCEGAVELHVDILLDVIDNTPSLDGARFCAVYLQSNGCEQPEGYDWTVEIPPGRSAVPQDTAPSSTPLKIVHISDIHYEPDYVVGSLADCKQPVCCVNTSGYPEKEGDTAAGLYGMYGDCDTPWVTVLSTFENIAKNNPDVDAIYYTGDTIHHRIWDTSVDSNSKVLNDILLQLNQSFPGIPVIPVIGNHEPSPVNAFAPTDVISSNLTTKWLYEVFAENLQQWFPSSAIKTMKTGGYFTIKLKDNLRIVVLNSNLCITENWWLLYKTWYKDPADQLKWLVEVLLEAERNSELVHILSHISSASGDCLDVWSREYRKIIERFRYTIAGQFFGHSHRDDYGLYFDSNTSEPINVGFNGGSVQPGVNPNYIVYQVDSGNYSVVEKQSWIFNLSKANLEPQTKPTWYKLYDFKEEFGVSDLSPESLYGLVQEMATNTTLREKYVRYRYKGENISCDDSCYKSVLCRLVSSEVSDDTQCNEIKSIYQ